MVAAGVFGVEQKAPAMFDDLLATDVELAQRLQARSLVCAPLVVAGEVTGYLVATAAEPGRFDQALTASLQYIADQGTVTVQRERLAERDRAHRGRLSFLAEALGELLAGVHDEELIAGSDGPAGRPEDRHLGGGLPDRPGRHDQARARVAQRGTPQRRPAPGLCPSIPRSTLGEVTWPVGP